MRRTLPPHSPSTYDHTTDTGNNAPTMPSYAPTEGDGPGTLRSSLFVSASCAANQRVGIRRADDAPLMFTRTIRLLDRAPYRLRRTRSTTQTRGPAGSPMTVTPITTWVPRAPRPQV